MKFKKTSRLKLITALAIALLMSGCMASAFISHTKKPTNLKVKQGAWIGVIFTDQYPMKQLNKEGFDLGKRFTPNRKDIEAANHIVLFQTIGPDKANSDIYMPSPLLDKNIHNIKSYFSQYVGYITNNGDKVIHINYLWNEKPNESIGYEDDYIVINGDQYWHADINLTTQKLLDVRINEK